MSHFDDTIHWPDAPDSFVWLFNRGQTDDRESTILYAEHYNKIRNFVVKAESLMDPDFAAIGDGTIKAIAYAFQVNVNLGVLALQHFPDPAGLHAIPGNVLPFELVFTTATNDYTKWPGKSALLVQGASAVVAAVVQGLDTFSMYPMATAAVRPNVPLGNLNQGNMPTFAGTRYVVSHHCLLGPSVASGAIDTLVLRGSIADLGTDPQLDFPYLPKAPGDLLDPDLNLIISLTGVKR